MPQTEDVDWNFPVLVEDVVMMGRYGKMNSLRIPSREDRLRVDKALERVGSGASCAADRSASCPAARKTRVSRARWRSRARYCCWTSRSPAWM